MTSNNAWEEETRQTLSVIQSELHEAEQEAQEANEKAVRLTREAEAMKLALEIHLQRTGKGQTVEKDMGELLASQKNHRERIKRIAERNNGLLKVSTAANILYNHQLIKSKTPMHAYRIVYGLLINMTEEGIFQKSAPGVFRLVNYLPILDIK